METRYVGVDLAWSPRHPTGLAALSLRRGVLEVAAVERRRTDDEIVDFVLRQRARRTIVMVDAPLVLPNPSGMRECDRETHRRFGARQAGAYPANRGNMGRWNGGQPRGESIARRLESLGFHGPARPLPSPPVPAGGFVFECYPHPAIVTLFGLDRSLKYKLKRQGYARARSEFRRYLRGMRGLNRPPIHWTADLLASLDVKRAVGMAYKDCEDRLDALLCAYLAALLPTGDLEMIGEPALGSIVVPRDPFLQTVAER